MSQANINNTVVQLPVAPTQPTPVQPPKPKSKKSKSKSKKNKYEKSRTFLLICYPDTLTNLNITQLDENDNAIDYNFSGDDWQEALSTELECKVIISPCHDQCPKENNSNDEPEPDGDGDGASKFKKKHYHVILYFNNARSLKSIIKSLQNLFGTPEQKFTIDKKGAKKYNSDSKRDKELNSSINGIAKPQTCSDFNASMRYLCHLDDLTKVEYSIDDIVTFNYSLEKVHESLDLGHLANIDYMREIIEIIQDFDIYEFSELVEILQKEEEYERMLKEVRNKTFFYTNYIASRRFQNTIFKDCTQLLKNASTNDKIEILLNGKVYSTYNK